MKAGLLVHDSEVMLDRVDMRAGRVARICTGDQLGERGDDREASGSAARLAVRRRENR